MSRSSTRLINMQSLLAICGMAGPIFYVVLLVTLGAIEPNYSHLSQTMSELGTVDARYNIIMNIAGFSLLGLLLIAFAVGLERSIADGRLPRIGPALIVLSGLCLIMVAIFPCDPDGMDVTSVGKIHRAFAVLAAFAITFSMLAISPRLWGDSRWRSYATFSIWATVMTLMIAAIYGCGIFESWEGAMQRILMAVPLIWVEVMAIKLLRLSWRSSTLGSLC